MYNDVKLPSPTFLTLTVDYVSHSYSTRGREQKNLRLMKPRTESLRKTVYYTTHAGSTMLIFNVASFVTISGFWIVIMIPS